MSDTIPTIYCANHPDVETSLRCNSCDKPICPRCAVLTPTGYRCKECVRGQQKKFDTAEWYDYPLAFTIALVLSFLGSLLVVMIGFFTIFVAPIAGVVIAEAVRRVTRRRRSRQLFLITTAGAVLGCLPLLISALLPAFMGAGLGNLFGVIWQGLYTFTVPSSVYYRLAGIQIRR